MTRQSYDKQAHQRRAIRTECRECGVICEWVVHPAHCLRSGCRFVYAFHEGSTTFFGCLEKVFAAELDLAPFRSSSRNRDVYGAMKAVRMPRSECRVQIERAYAFRYQWHCCSNPTFLHHPDDYAPEAIRLMVNRRGDPSQ